MAGGERRLRDPATRYYWGPRRRILRFGHVRHRCGVRPDGILLWTAPRQCAHARRHRREPASGGQLLAGVRDRHGRPAVRAGGGLGSLRAWTAALAAREWHPFGPDRSEERRVGKECGCGW